MSKRSTKSNYHTPVLLEESIDGLNVLPGGVYVDATFGGGGHAKPILNRMNAKGRLFGFDQDEEAARNVPEDSRFTFIRANFRYLINFMRYYEIEQVDGILADLGVSSHHFDEPERGFSYRHDVRLDMRMNQSTLVDARSVLNTYDPARLQEMFSAYGEIRNAKTLSLSIVEARREMALEKVGDLVKVVDQTYRGDRQKYLSQVFQAVRIEVNDELGALQDMLIQGRQLLRSGGRFVVISYHSLEDRLVKNFFRSDNFEGRPRQDDFGKRISEFVDLTKKPIVASIAERKENSRSISAKMRIAQRL